LNCWPFEREHQKAGFVQLLIFPFHFLEGLVLLLLGSTTTTSTHTHTHRNQKTISLQSINFIKKKKRKKSPEKC
jgi:hypothetical protein